MPKETSLSSSSYSKILLALFVLLASLILPLHSPVTALADQPANFEIKGSQIFDPNGQLFIPRGVNLAGTSYWLDASSLGLGSVAHDSWNFNTVRLNMCYAAAFCNHGTSGDWAKLDSYVNEYTNLGIVVMLELHDFTCAYPSPDELSAALGWIKSAAMRYKDSTYVKNYQYVWFNGFNEIGNEDPIATRWLEVNQQVVTTIREEAQSSNLIVFDGTKCGQDSWISNSAVPTAQSAILTYGDILKSFNAKTYPNIMFSLHAYDLWGDANLSEAQRDEHLTNFIDRVQQAGHALMIGETGWDYTGPNPASPLEYKYAAQSVFRVAPSKGVGILGWHGQPNDADNQSNFSLVNTGLNWFSEINDPSSPTNLTELGSLLWNYTHTFPASIPPASKPKKA